MKRLLFAFGATLGIYMLCKKLFETNGLVTANINKGGIIANAEHDEDDFSQKQIIPINTDKEILADGGNENGGTGGSIKESVGDENIQTPSL